MTTSTMVTHVNLPEHVPDVIALLQVFNEELILQACLEHLVGQGIGVHVLDNWSTDDSMAIAESFVGRGVVGVERFPTVQPEGRSYQLTAILQRKQELALELAGRGARWLMHYDADEIRQSPWPGVSLREGLLRAEKEGYNTVDHVVVNFVPTDEGFRRGISPTEHFRYYLPASSAVRHGKAWIQGRKAVDLASSGGHFVKFRGRHIYPIPFVICHYPVLSTEHGLRKVFRERKPRYSQDGLSRGWHTHYNNVENKAHRFVYSPDDPKLVRYDEELFKRKLQESHVAKKGWLSSLLGR